MEKIELARKIVELIKYKKIAQNTKYSSDLAKYKKLEKELLNDAGKIIIDEENKKQTNILFI